jgi:hypothetical protein
MLKLTIILFISTAAMLFYVIRYRIHLLQASMARKNPRRRS